MTETALKQALCAHPIEHVVQGEAQRSDDSEGFQAYLAPFRVCLDCGYSEALWGGCAGPRLLGVGPDDVPVWPRAKAAAHVVKVGP